MLKKTQVGIIGAGPAGLTLALLLQNAGVACVILESRSKDYVESRIRAGLLEQNTVDLLTELGAAERLKKEGLQHHGVYLSFNGEKIRVPFYELTAGRSITIYGQQEIVKDLIRINTERKVEILFETTDVTIEGINTAIPQINFSQNNGQHSLVCDFIAGCDGYHGISRKALPADCYKEHKKEYPFSWLGILAQAVPSSEELIYACHKNGFALHSLRSKTVSRLYLQVENGDTVDNWPDEKIWNELEVRLEDNTGFILNKGKIFEKSITPMRSFMIDNLQYGKLYLAGDAAHIVPPTGGKGLNLAVADVKWLAAAYIDFYKNNKLHLLNNYSANALRRVWRAQDFSNFMTSLFHIQAPYGSFEYNLQKARFDYIKLSKACVTTIAENYVGLKEV